MQDEDYNERELHAVAATLLVKEIPRPKTGQPIPAADAERLEKFDLALLAAHFREIGVGPIVNGRAVLPAPCQFDHVFETLDVSPQDDVTFALVYSAVGRLTGLTRAGRSILIDPLHSMVQIAPPLEEREEPLFFQINWAQEVSSVLSELREGDTEIDLQGRPLLPSLIRLLGPLSVGNCYVPTLPIDDPQAFSPETWQQENIADYILKRHAEQPFEVIEIPQDTEAGLAGNYGDDWH